MMFAFDFDIKIVMKQARKPRSYASLKLRPTDSLTRVKSPVSLDTPSPTGGTEWPFRCLDSTSIGSYCRRYDSESLIWSEKKNCWNCIQDLKLRLGSTKTMNIMLSWPLSSLLHSNYECFDLMVIKFLSADCINCRGNRPRENAYG